MALAPVTTLEGTLFPVRLYPQSESRFIKLNASGGPLSNQQLGYQQLPWSCVHDRSTNLIWEVKSSEQSLHYTHYTYAWLNSDDVTLNHGKQDKPCTIQPCSSSTYIQSTNKEGLCGLTGWRLPSREELRSLVDYSIRYPGPTIEIAFFPNTVNQFYWSATPNANNNESAWGIGFSFGYDYAYFKSNLAHLRLVHGPVK